MAARVKIPVIVVPGTFWKEVASWRETYSPTNKPMQEVARIFGVEPLLFEWSGANSARSRHAAAESLARFIENAGPMVHVVGFSHGGNVACEAAAKLATRVDHLVTIATPVTGKYKTGGMKRHVHLYNPQDRMQMFGGEGPLGLPWLAKREFPGAINLAVPSVESRDLSGAHGDILWNDETWRILESALNERL